MVTPHRPPGSVRSLDDLIIRYDLDAMRVEVQQDFSPEIGAQRLLNQGDITARFRKKSKPCKPRD